MRVLHMFDHSLPLHSGYSFRSRAILQAQRARGWQTAHVTSPKHTADGPRDEEAEGFLFHRSDSVGAGLPGLVERAQIAASARRLEEIARQFKPDVLHAHSPALNALAAHRVARRLGIPWIYEIRAFWEDAAVGNGTSREGSLRYRLTRAMESWAVARADGVTAICNGLLDDLRLRGVPDRKLQPIPNAVDVEAFTPPARDGALAAELGLDDRLVLGFLGSFYDYEGLDILVDALALLSDRLPNATLLLVGGGPREDAIKAQVARLGLQDRVVFTGRVPQSQVGRYYGLVDLLVFPRKSMRLTELVTPLKPLEAMAQRKLVLASDVGGHRELIRDDDTGWLFAPDDPRALADRVADVAGRRSEWGRILDSGLYFVTNERTWTRSVANYQTLFDRIGITAATG